MGTCFNKTNDVQLNNNDNNNRDETDGRSSNITVNNNDNIDDNNDEYGNYKANQPQLQRPKLLSEKLKT